MRRQVWKVGSFVHFISVCVSIWLCWWTLNTHVDAVVVCWRHNKSCRGRAAVITALSASTTTHIGTRYNFYRHSLERVYQHCSSNILIMTLNTQVFAFYCNCGAILYRLQDIATYWSKIAKFLHPTCIQCSPQAVPRRNFAKMFDTHKTRMIGVRCGEDTMTIMSSNFNRIPERDGRTERQRDRQTDRQTDKISILISRVIEIYSAIFGQ